MQRSGCSHGRNTKSNQMRERKIMDVNKLNKYSKRIGTLKVKDLIIDNYQRQLRVSNVNKIVRNFNPVGFGLLQVSHRDGKYFVFDGQHRLEAAKRLKMVTVECLVYEGMSYEDEANAWKYFNGSSTKPTQLDKAKVELITGDPEAMALDDCVNKTGLYIDYENQGSNGSIGAYKTLKKVFSDHGEMNLMKTLAILKRAFGIERKAFQESTIFGVSNFIVEYSTNEKYDEKWLIKRLEETGVDPLINMINQSKKMFNTTKKEAATSVLLQIYNKNKLKSNKL